MALPNDVQYFLDCALDSHDVNPFCHGALTLYGDPKVVSGIVDSSVDMYDRINNTCPKGLSLDAYAYSLTIPTVERRALVASALIAEPSRLKDLAECLSSWNYDDSTEGGALEPFRRGHERLNRDETPWKRTAAKLHAPLAIRRYVKLHRSQAAQKRLAAENLRRETWPSSPSEASAITEIFSERRRQYIAAAQRLAITQLSTLEGTLTRHKIKVVREQQKIARRAAASAESILGAESVRIFARGDPVFLSGHLFVFAVTGSALAIGNGATTIALLKTEDRKPLAGLCLYFDGTPALDQLAAIALHIRAGEELDLVDAGNLYAVTAEGVADPYLASRMISRRADIDNAARPVRDLRRRYDLRAAYIEESRVKYLAVVGPLVWGRDYARLLKFCEKEP